MRLNLLLFILTFLIVKTIAADQGNTAAKSFQCVRVHEKITIDGNLNEGVWKGPSYSDLYQQEPRQGEKPSQHTEVWFAYDDENIYFAAKCYDTHPDSILARLVRRDFVFGDPSDGLLLYLDTYHDRRGGYLFYVSSAGTLADGTFDNDNKETDLTWDGVWEGKVQIHEDGYYVEMKIPLSQLRFQASDYQEWGFDIERYFSRNAETDMVAYTPRNESGFASRFPTLTGIQGIKSGTGIELLPYVTGKAEILNKSAGDPFKSQTFTPGLGLDLKTPVGNRLKLNATINPDFGQVEVDPAVLNLTDVEYTFQEKRPFFTEGLTIFRFGRGGINNWENYNWNNPSIFYTRRIGRSPQRSVSADYADVPKGTHILGAGKIVGEILDGWKIGMVHALTKREYGDFSTNDEKSTLEIEPATYYGVVRAQKQFDEGKKGLGFLGTYTNRFFKDASLNDELNKNAVVAGVDGWTNLDNDGTYVVTGWAAGSRISGSKEQILAVQRSSLHYFQRPDASHLSVDSQATSLSGYAGRIVLNKNRGEWSLNAAIGAISPGFENNDLGYNSYSDYINMHISTGYKWAQPTDFYQNCGVSIAAFTGMDFGGNKTIEGIYTGGWMNLHDLSGMGYNVNITDETYNARKTRGGPLTINPASQGFGAYYYTNNRTWYVINPSFYLRFGKDGKYQDYSLGIEFKLTPTLTLNVAPDYQINDLNAQWVTRYSDQTATETYNSRYVFAQLMQKTLSTDIRLDWIVSPELSVQAYFQPFITSGRYSHYKALVAPKTYEFMEYGTGQSVLQTGKYSDGTSYFILDADGKGPAKEKQIDNPDGDYISFRGNAVIRWEYRPGSALYLVWTQSRESSSPNNDSVFGRFGQDLFREKPDNIFMVKFTYWFGS